MNHSTISDRALDLGIFALDNELEREQDRPEPMYYETFTQLVTGKRKYAALAVDELKIVVRS